MMRWLLALLIMATAATAEEDGPTLSTEVKETEAIPGQFLTVRITVLVPTYMPQPPVWPSYEAPNLLVRLPEKSTSPTSQRIGSATWSGITRRYQISPMVPGGFTLPASEVIVTWADPDTNEPRQTMLRTEPVTLTGVVPEGAEGLDPFIAAESLELKATVEGEPAQMKPGDSVIRTLVATVDGTSPMFLPSLAPQVEVPGLRVYPDEPALEETDNRGELSGMRTERVTYLAEGGGSGQVDGVTLDWFNLKTGKVETASIDGFDVQIEGPPLQTGPRVTRAQVVRWLVGLVGALIVLFVIQRAWPMIQRWRAARNARYVSSERYAWREVKRAVNARNLGAVFVALDVWYERRGDRETAAVAAALQVLERAKYGADRGAKLSDAWAELTRSLQHQRNNTRRRRRTQVVLPALN
ncbi:MAG: hypothetical protein AB3N23_13990 [Paracoccaceae bacterium]